MTCARDLARPYPTVRVDDDAQEAARLLVRERLPALLVLDQVACPYAIVPATQLLTTLIPEEQDLLTTVFGTPARQDTRPVLTGRSVADWLPRHHTTPGLAEPTASPQEVATLMTRKDCPVVAVIDNTGGTPTLLGAITADILLKHFIEGP